MERFEIRVKVEEIKEVMPVVVLQVEALQRKTTAEEIRSINEMSPILEEIKGLQIKVAKRFEQFEQDWNSRPVMESDQMENTIEEMAECIEVEFIKQDGLTLEERIAYATLAMGELAFAISVEEDILKAVALASVGYARYAELLEEDEEMSDLWMDSMDNVLGLVDEAIETGKEEFPILTEKAVEMRVQMLEAIEELTEQTVKNREMIQEAIEELTEKLVKAREMIQEAAIEERV